MLGPGSMHNLSFVHKLSPIGSRNCFIWTVTWSLLQAKSSPHEHQVLQFHVKFFHKIQKCGGGKEMPTAFVVVHISCNWDIAEETLAANTNTHKIKVKRPINTDLGLMIPWPKIALEDT
jgi:hypothetical protein